MPDETSPLRERLSAALGRSRLGAVTADTTDPTDPTEHDYTDDGTQEDTTTMPSETITITITDSTGTELKSVTLTVDGTVDFSVTAADTDGDSGN